MEGAMDELFTVAKLIALLDRNNILTLEDLKDAVGENKEISFRELESVLNEYSQNQGKLTISDLRRMTDDAHVMIPEPDVDPPQS